MKAFLLVFDGTKPEGRRWLDTVDRIAAVENWQSLFDGSVVLVSGQDTKELARLIRDRMPGQRFAVTELRRDSREGWLPEELWDFMNDPKPAGGGA